MMGDKFQLGPFTDVIDDVRQRVTRGTEFFENFLRAAVFIFLLYVLVGRCPGSGGALEW
ncbi:hypothetical protein ABIE35_001658 [Paenarthrobacter sp. 4246]